ncbi:hypothetical protein PSPO01_10246 [Paraphaeosphaeria sporulosa]
MPSGFYDESRAEQLMEVRRSFGSPDCAHAVRQKRHSPPSKRGWKRQKPCILSRRGYRRRRDAAGVPACHQDVAAVIRWKPHHPSSCPQMQLGQSLAANAQHRALGGHGELRVLSEDARGAAASLRPGRRTSFSGPCSSVPAA